MRRVIVETPYRATTPIARIAHKLYLARALRDCYERGESPYASHAIGPMGLSDDNEDERAIGIRAGEEWRAAAEATVVYSDYGVTKGMRDGIDAAKDLGQPIEYRSLRTS